MERQLDPAAGAVLAAHAGRARRRASRWTRPRSRSRPAPDGVEVALADGRRLDGRPARGRLRGPAVHRGWPRRPGSASTAASSSTTGCAPATARIFAIGDCAQHAGAVGGLVAPAWEQARVVADVVTGSRPLARYAAAPAGHPAQGGRHRPRRDGRLDRRRRTTRRGRDVRRPGPRHLRQAGRRATTGSPARSCSATTRPSARSSSSSTAAAGCRPTRARCCSAGASARPRRSAEPSPALMPDAAVICQCNTVTKGALVRVLAGRRPVGRRPRRRHPGHHRLRQLPATRSTASPTWLRPGGEPACA